MRIGPRVRQLMLLMQVVLKKTKLQLLEKKQRVPLRMPSPSTELQR
jgi:hypothetical protein